MSDIEAILGTDLMFHITGTIPQEYSELDYTSKFIYHGKVIVKNIHLSPDNYELSSHLKTL